MIGLGFASDWFREWHEFSGIIAKRSKEKPMQFQIIADYFGPNCSMDEVERNIVICQQQVVQSDNVQ